MMIPLLAMSSSLRFGMRRICYDTLLNLLVISHIIVRLYNLEQCMSI